ncbi:hypothetical protein SERLADRAFT_434101 [Serpula lacrymans var. lacrymans S7.9]|uniref:Retrovirus-related Pol polyprotein from transposon TNT 1-94-like beta-barrel domain-containing protein n=1 Tax=Serpula lacrymans var. lacrymans (strain S7.9) TaxID=578457 RepID=F8NLP7_SERL9|nr:uncharacterized protein SERLADRAFT_434101 [Serpula lacrymans var. lacrymans S7.9]EGO28228.1 hypothetical protein SERLADRAFT_434101 [Serpula lacrymans var. lacrymans S7.9]
MVPHRSWFEPGTYHVLNPPRTISFGDESSVNTIGIETVILQITIGKKNYNIALSNILLVPNFTLALISLHKLSKTGLSTLFPAGSNACEVCKKKELILTALHKHGLYHTQAKPKINLESAFTAVDDIDTLTGTPDFCEPCVLGKMKKLPFKSTGGNCAKRPIQIVHTDVGGPIKTTSREGFRY